MFKEIYRDYTDLAKDEAESISALKGLNLILAAQAFVNYLIFIGSGTRFNKPAEESPWWLGAKLLYTDVEIWEAIFAALSVIMVISTLVMYKVKYVTSIVGMMWVLFGLAWVTGSFVADQDALFGRGLISLLIGASHFSVARAWRAEGVE